MSIVVCGKEFASKELAFDFIRENKNVILMEKKSRIKHADAVIYQPELIRGEGGEVAKAIEFSKDSPLAPFMAKLVINTTNIMDSHSDVHFPGIWKKSLQENKNIIFLQEHVMRFPNVISDRVKATAETIAWKDLGYKYEGSTQALVFETQIDPDRNPYMAEQYAKGYVKNHSVGMQYVNIAFALNSESKYDKDEKAVWDKYIGQIVNRDAVEAQGYFFAVFEAKCIEGSAVVMGSNFATPVLEITEGAGKSTPENEPPEGTQEKKTGWEYFKFN